MKIYFADVLALAAVVGMFHYAATDSKEENIEEKKTKPKIRNTISEKRKRKEAENIATNLITVFLSGILNNNYSTDEIYDCINTVSLSPEEKSHLKERIDKTKFSFFLEKTHVDIDVNNINIEHGINIMRLLSDGILIKKNNNGSMISYVFKEFAEKFKGNYIELYYQLDTRQWKINHQYIKHLLEPKSY